MNFEVFIKKIYVGQKQRRTYRDHTGKTKKTNFVSKYTVNFTITRKSRKFRFFQTKLL